MKKVLFILSAVIFSTTMLEAQDAPKDTSWKVGGITAVSFSQVSLTNWSAGGDNSMALNALLSTFANYKKGHWAWDNSLLLAYGLVRLNQDEMRKNDDKIELQLKPGYEFKKHWYISYLLNFKTQFDKGYDYSLPDSVTPPLVSQFLAPAYLINSIGLEFKPNDDFYLYLSPVTSKITIVNVDNEIISHASYAVDADKNGRAEFGFYLSTRYKKEIMKNVAIATKVDLFSNYKENPQNVDVNWEFLLAMKVNKFITVSLSTTLIYDDDIVVPKKKDDINYDGKGTQFKEVFGVGLSYKFGK